MVRILRIEKEHYYDSVTMMKVTSEISAMPGIKQAAVAMGTPLNKKFMVDVGFDEGKLAEATSNDLVIAIEAIDEGSLNAALAKTEELLSSTSHIKQVATFPRTLDSALVEMPDANMVCISVPGQYAKREAIKSLERGLNVFLFSSDVLGSDEVELKRKAEERGLLVMGPDCGTAIINGVALGFGNAVRKGRIGVVSASGTGAQEVTTLVHKMGFGISHVIGTGSNDLSREVGGITTIRGLKLLSSDPGTDVIILIAKSVDPKIADIVLETAGNCGKPIIVNFLGSEHKYRRWGNLTPCSTLEETAVEACKAVSGRKISIERPDLFALARREWGRLSDRQEYVRGLYSGGTLCYEAQKVLLPVFGKVYSNVPIRPQDRLQGMARSRQNTCIDMGTEEFVRGRAHPMIDFTLRKTRIKKEAEDPEVAVILLDVVLGYGANPDPAGELVPVVSATRESLAAEGRDVSFVASIVGTDLDPQNVLEQEKKLTEAGVAVLPSNAQAARFAAMVAKRGNL